MKIKTLSRSFFAAFLILSLASCSTTLISKFDASIEKEIELGRSMTSKAFDEAIQNPDKSFGANSVNWDIVAAQISSLIEKEAAREKSALLVAQVKELHKAFSKIVEHHLTNGELSNPYLEQYKQQMDAQWKSILSAEQRLPKSKTQK